MARNDTTKEAVKIHRDAIISAIKRDFLTKDVSFQDTKLMKHVAGYRRKSKNTPADMQAAIKEAVNGSVVAVGKGKTAIVKCP